MRRMLTVLAVGFLPIASCTENIDFSSEFEDKVTVNLILENKETQELTLCHNTEPGYFRYEEITDADVRLFDGETEVGRFTHERRMTWKLNYKPVAGHSYRLLIKVPGINEISAETIMPENVQMKRFRADQATTDNHKYFSQLEPAPPYWVFVMTRDEFDILLTKDTVRIESGDHLDDYIGSNHFAVDNFNMGDELMFSEFGMPGESFCHLGYLRIKETDNNVNYPVTFFIEARMRNAIVVFRVASTEYDKYMKSSLIKANAYQAEDDPTAYFEENVVYSNIKGGLGIFAACSDTLLARSFIIDD